MLPSSMAFPAPPPRPSRGVAISDWDELFHSVTTRLRLTAGDASSTSAVSGERGSDSRVLASVLECVEALELLHSALTQERGWRHQLELDFIDAQTELAQTRADLVGTRTDERRTRQLAAHDALTALPSRDSFRARIDRILAQAEPQSRTLAVLYLDLDGFKAINDVHGHEVGDDVLRIVATRLSRAVRAEDSVGRLGGDEFACLLSNLPNREQLSHLACKLFDGVSAPMKIGKLELTVRPSIGIAVCPSEGLSATALLNRADAAMAHAKRGRSGYAFFDERADVQANGVAS